MSDLAGDLRSFSAGIGLERLSQNRKPFTLWWQPDLDEGRASHLALLKRTRCLLEGKDVLEIGYSWGGRVFPGSKVLDLYDPRPGINYRLDACSMKGIADKSFDFVICVSVLEHIPRFWLAASEIQRVLRVGGVVWCGVPSVWPYHPGGEFKGDRYEFGGDYWRMNHAALEVLFDRCRKIVSWYVPASAKAGDDPRSGWGVTYIGEKTR